jgi:prefoldin subunit 5
MSKLSAIKLLRENNLALRAYVDSTPGTDDFYKKRLDYAKASDKLAEHIQELEHKAEQYDLIVQEAEQGMEKAYQMMKGKK